MYRHIQAVLANYQSSTNLANINLITKRRMDEIDATPNLSRNKAFKDENIVLFGKLKETVHFMVLIKT